jgi:hypothetical protein
VPFAFLSRRVRSEVYIGFVSGVICLESTRNQYGGRWRRVPSSGDGNLSTANIELEKLLKSVHFGFALYVYKPVEVPLGYVSPVVEYVVDIHH